MSVSEEARHELYLALEEVHGRSRATTLMSLLPPVGWADVATKRDLDHLEERMNLRFERAEGVNAARFGGLESRFAGQRGQLWKMFAMLVGLQVSAASLIIGLQQLP
ncbi:MAG: hypothetical protein ACR2H3_05425 [Acidimicrobiales bacterium]